jgi:hypothetical protein
MTGAREFPYNCAMTDKDHPDHQTEAEKKKQEAAKRLQEALDRKNQHNKPGGQGFHQQQGGAPKFSPRGAAPMRRGPRGG